MSIAVTGAYGQLGGELCRQLGAAAIPLDIDTLDLTDAEAVLRRMLELKPEAIINCAAYTQVDKAETEPERCRAVNAAAVEYLVRACRRLDCPLVQISTDYVFGGRPASPQPWREDDPSSPQGVYARTKLEGEQAAAAYPKHWIVRTCGLYARRPTGGRQTSCGPCSGWAPPEVSWASWPISIARRPTFRTWRGRYSSCWARRGAG